MTITSLSQMHLGCCHYLAFKIFFIGFPLPSRSMPKPFKEPTGPFKDSPLPTEQPFFHHFLPPLLSALTIKNFFSSSNATLVFRPLFLLFGTQFPCRSHLLLPRPYFFLIRFLLEAFSDPQSRVGSPPPSSYGTSASSITSVHVAQ